jgi:hypothetical protein
MDVERLDHEFVSGYYDEETRVLVVNYHKWLSSEITDLVYAWIARIITNDFDIIARSRGCIFDFSEVKKFDLDNLVATNQNSISFNSKFDMRTIPIGLITKTKPQHDYVSLTMKITPDEERKKIVETLEEAHAFINDFHHKISVQIQPISDKDEA